MTPLRIAVIGAGHLGRIHTRLLQSISDVALVGVVDPQQAARERAAAEFGVPTYAHHDEVADRIDGAIIAATTDRHFSIGAELLRSGIHLLVEKPLTASVAEADELVALAHSHRLVLQVGHVERFNPAWCAVRSLLHRPRYIEAVRSSSYTFRSTDVSVVLDLMIHDLDLALSVVASPVVDVDAVGVTVFGPHTDMAHAHLRFANDCIVSLNAARTSFQAQRTMQVITEQGYVGLDFAASTAKLVRPPQEVLRRRLDPQQLSVAEQEKIRQSLFTETLPLTELQVEGNAILDEQQEFVNCIRHRRTPRVSGEQARDTLVIAERILHSIAAKQDRSSGRTLPWRKAG